MQRTDIGLAMGGNVAFCIFTIGYQDLLAIAATSSGQLPLVYNQGALAFNIPAGGLMLGVRIHHTVSFAGGGPLTAMTVAVGNAGTANFFAPAFDIFQAAANNTLQETALFKAGTVAAVPVTVTFTATGGNLSQLTAGSVDIWLYWLNVSSPNLP
jgi:hypothetical protein